jgi:hypothetical protein
MRLYRADPQAHGRGDTVWWVAVVMGLVVGGVILLVSGR